MTPIEKNATLVWALDLWAGMIRNDFAEYRKHWYPAASPGLCGKGGKGEEAYEELESSFEASVVGAVEGAVKSLTAPQRACLERHLELTMVCRVPHYEDRLAEAMQKVWLALVANGSSGA